jgi:hypothetical protein
MPLMRSRDGRLYNVPDEIAARFSIPPLFLAATFRQAGMQLPIAGMTPGQCMVEAYHWGHFVTATALASVLMQFPAWGGVVSSPTCVCSASPAPAAMPAPAALAGGDIFTACYTGDIAAVANMLNANPSLLYARTLDGRTLLHLAASSGSAELVELLLARGAPVDGRDMFGLTPLHVATVKSRAEVAETLLRHGAPVNVRHNYGKTPLGAAMAMDSKPLIALLSQYGGIE